MDDDTTTVCPNAECNEPRFEEDATTPREQMACVSIGKSLCQMLLDDDTRELFKYKSNFAFNNNQLFDVFSGENFQYLQNNGIISRNDICMVMYVDGFQNKHKPDHNQTMIHSIVMNIDPSVR